MVKVKERPIIFKGEMVRAILEGRKVQTRRPVKPQPVFTEFGSCWYPDKPKNFFSRWERGLAYATEEHFRKGVVRDFCPYGQPGDRLWVRETFMQTETKEFAPGPYVYRADGWESQNKFHPIVWTPSIHMPRAASRITLEITNVRVERIQDMGMDDVRREGYRPDFDTLDFSQSWNATYHGSWDRNEWVWVIEFTLVK